jgi:ParB-like chromosome segregation protein Spo0J
VAQLSEAYAEAPPEPPAAAPDEFEHRSRIDPRIAVVDLDELVVAGSPRLDGQDERHARMLAALTGALPPIVVHRGSMRVIDGAHRLRAAQLRGQREIEVRFFDGGEEEAFILAVGANVADGLPLPLADRTGAAHRILQFRPAWSNRRIASVVGLAANTVAAIRRRATGQSACLPIRVGADGKARPVDPNQGREAASRLIAQDPGASLREIARRSGISPGTVRDVRERMRRGESPLVQPAVPVRRTAAVPVDLARAAAEPVPAPGDGRELLGSLRSDPSLRFNQVGRSLLRWLEVCAVDQQGWEQVLRNIPPHCAELVADAARECARTWEKVADEVRRRGDEQL